MPTLYCVRMTPDRPFNFPLAGSLPHPVLGKDMHRPILRDKSGVDLQLQDCARMRQSSRMRRPRTGMPQRNDILASANYITRTGQLAAAMADYGLHEPDYASGLRRTGDLIPPEVFAATAGLHAGGGVVETVLTVRNFLDSARTRLGEEEARRQSEEAGADLARALDTRRHAAPRDPCFLMHTGPEAREDAGRQAALQAARYLPLAARSMRAPASERFTERTIDVFRYAVLGWCARIVGGLRAALQAIPWIAIASAALGMAGAALQAVSGAVKWRTASRAAGRARRAVWRCAPPPGIRCGKLEHALRAHARSACVQSLREAKSRRWRARVETAAGIATLLCLGLSLAFPPAMLVAWQIMLMYALYRVTVAALAWRRTRCEESRRRLESESESRRRDVAAAIDAAARREAPWLKELMQDCGAPRMEADALLVLARDGGRDELLLAQSILERRLQQAPHVSKRHCF
ncbi:hypothetical protein [Noviherbaspirillum galbum]|uniref:Uncharacterized protein n=1 Tax=Noviherbaspirillum galbum TaxID=2709383 RepID=A0A6B3SY52_9BURK|nr:hypothetical protein [Noviherbaspirillum galbum]NEX64196.1 hypothetical protein [Noviherbaspirillum galbum]